MTTTRLEALAFLAICAGLAACDDGTGTASTGGGGATTASTDASTADASSSGDASSADSTTGAGSTSTSSGGPIRDCADIGAMECFSSYDCPDLATRCENQGTPDFAVPCCVPGQRGSGLAGDPCTGENDCKSSLCFEIGSGSVCTDVCMGDGDCPKPPFDGCGPIQFSGSNDEFCLP